MKISQNANSRILISALGQMLERLHPATPSINSISCVIPSTTIPMLLHIGNACVKMERLQRRKRESLLYSTISHVTDVEIAVIGARQHSISHMIPP
jgi:hypothetical protein